MHVHVTMRAHASGFMLGDQACRGGWEGQGLRATIAGMEVLFQEVDEALHVGQGTSRLAFTPLAQQIDCQLGSALVG